MKIKTEEIIERNFFDIIFDAACGMPDRYAEDYKIENFTVTRNEKLEINLAPGGGWAAVFKKK